MRLSGPVLLVWCERVGRKEGGRGRGERGEGKGSKMHACSLLSVQLFTPIIWYAVAVSLLLLNICLIRFLNISVLLCCSFSAYLLHHFNLNLTSPIFRFFPTLQLDFTLHTFFPL